MVDKEPTLNEEISLEIIEQASSVLVEMAKNIGVDEVALAAEVAKHIQTNRAPAVELEKEVPVKATRVVEKKNRNTSVSPFRLFLDGLAEKNAETNGVIKSRVLAYGKRQTETSASEFTEFGTQSKNGFTVFNNLYGVDYLNYAAGDAFSKKSEIKFLDEVDIANVYPPAVIVQRSSNNVIMSTIRHYDEFAYARSLGKSVDESRTTRTYFDYRSHTISEHDAIQLTNIGLPWNIAFSRSAQIHVFPIFDSVDKEQLLDMANTQGQLEITSEIFNNQEDFSKLFGICLLSISAGQPIFLEQNWTLDEKSMFIQMLQQSLTAMDKDRLISWSSEPIVAVSKELDVIFRKPGESTVNPMNKDWAGYKVVDENNNEIIPTEQRYLEEIYSVFSSTSTWSEIEERLHDNGEGLKKYIEKAVLEYESQRVERISSLQADRNRRLEIVRSAFLFNKNDVSLEFADWICPRGTRELPPTFNLPDSYYSAYKKGEFPGYYIMEDTGLTEARFVYTFLKEHSDGLQNFNPHIRVSKKVFEYMARNFIKDTGTSISIDTRGLCASLDVSHAFEQAMSITTGSNHIFAEAFGQKDVLNSIQKTIASLKKEQVGYVEKNPLFKKQISGGYTLSAQGKSLIERHFPSGQEPYSQVDYLNQWISFLSEFASIKMK